MITELKKQGIKEVEFWKFKLYNPKKFEKFLWQAKISLPLAVKIIKKGR